MEPLKNNRKEFDMEELFIIHTIFMGVCFGVSYYKLSNIDIELEYCLSELEKTYLERKRQITDFICIFINCFNICISIILIIIIR